MGSTFLVLTNKLLRRFNELELNSVTFSGAKGIHSLAKDGIIASLNIINQQDWKWSFNYITSGVADFTLTIGQELYNYPLSSEDVDIDNAHILKTTTPDQQAVKLNAISHNDYKLYFHQDALNHTTASQYGLPRYICKTPDLKLIFHIKPDKAYAVNIPYWSIPTEPSNATDTINIPTRFDDVIVDGGIWYMATMRNDTERAVLGLEKKHMTGIARMKRLLLGANINSFTSTMIPGNSGYSSRYINDTYGA